MERHLEPLADGERHGHGIILEIERRTGGAVKLRTGTLYTALARMLKLGLIEETDDRPDPEFDDERRRYYRLTPFGREVTKAEAARMRALVALATDKKVIARRCARWCSSHLRAAFRARF